MTFIALGINHNTASLEIRERVAFAPAEIEQALQNAQNSSVASEIAILSTCNRTEIYCQSESDSD